MNQPALFTAFLILNLFAMYQSSPLYDKRPEYSMQELLPNGFEDLLIKPLISPKRDLHVLGNIFHGARGKRVNKGSTQPAERDELVSAINNLNRLLTKALADVKKQNKTYNGGNTLSDNRFH